MEHLTCQIKTNRTSKNCGGPELDSLNQEGVNMIYDQTYPSPDFNDLIVLLSVQNRHASDVV